ncbi:MAG: hypothetical protein AB7V22_02130 [Kiritimatiellia bacterium]
MTTKRIQWTGAVTLACLAATVFAQQPSPAYFQSGGTLYQAVPAQPAHAQPVYYGPPPAQPAYYAPPAAQPVYYAPPPAEPVYAEEEDVDEEGYYWMWGQKWPGLALGPKFGTTGLGLEMTFGINPYLNLRGGFNYGSFTLGQEFGNVDYDVDLTMISIPLMLDVHPFGGQFRLTGGLYVQPGTKAELDATPSGPTQIGSHTYPADVIGTLTGKIEAGDVVAPYLGLGIGNAVGEDQRLLVTLDVGVIFQSYDVSLDSNGAGMTTANALFREDLKKEEGLLQKDADDWKIYPVVAIAIAWHF